MQITDSSRGVTISEWGMNNPCIRLAESHPVARATDKALSEIHTAGLRNFERMRISDELPENKSAKATTLPMYAKLITYSQGMHEVNAAAIKVEGRNVTYVTMEESPRINTSSHVKSEQDRFGIGTYFVDPVETYEEADILPLIEKAQAIEKARIEKRQREQDEYNAIIARGKEEAEKTPLWAKAAIILEPVIDDSDPYTDYFASHPDRENAGIIAWSSHERNIEAELRQAMINLPELAGENFELEKSPYRLQTAYNSGWRVRKLALSRENENYLFEILGRGNCIATTTPPQTEERNEPTTGARIQYNRVKNGIEIYFNGKPEDTVLDDLKRNGFRWAKFNKCWYKTDTPHARMVAARYGELPGEGREQANDTFDLDDMLEQQAEQWSQHN